MMSVDRSFEDACSSLEELLRSKCVRSDLLSTQHLGWQATLLAFEHGREEASEFVDAAAGKFEPQAAEASVSHRALESMGKSAADETIIPFENHSCCSARISDV